MAHKRQPLKGLSPMEKKVPVNKKYSNVESKLDTGLTVHKVKYVSTREYAKRRDEIYFRISPEQLYELYCEYEADEYEDIAEAAGDERGPRIVTYSEAETPTNNKPYLILDVRSLEEFNNYHLLQARTFPYVMLRRDQTHPELHTFKNKPGHLIIVVSEDEREGRDAAKTLVDRGTDNIYLLTGGIKEFAQEYPAFVEGNPPSPPKKPSAKINITTSGISTLSEEKIEKHNQQYAKSSQRSDDKSTTSGLRSPRSIKSKDGPKATGIAALKLSMRDDMSTLSRRSQKSVATNVTVADSVIAKATARKGKF